MLELYLPIVIFLAVGLVFGLAPIVLGFLLAPRHPDAVKNAPYECGYSPFEDARLKFDVRFYLVAILFIIFDLEIAFMLPFAVVMRQLSSAAMAGMGLFVALLLVGFIYEWRKGALEWE